MWKIKAFKYRVSTKFTQWLSHRLPKKLRYFTAIDVFAYATCGKYGSTNATDITAMEAIRRFEKDKKIK